MNPEEEGIGPVRLISRRQIDVQIALDSQRLRPNPPITPMIVSEIDYVARQSPVESLQVACVEPDAKEERNERPGQKTQGCSMHGRVFQRLRAGFPKANSRITVRPTFAPLMS
jgi:hypothetical protein